MRGGGKATEVRKDGNKPLNNTGESSRVVTHFQKIIAIIKIDEVCTILKCMKIIVKFIAMIKIDKDCTILKCIKIDKAILKCVQSLFNARRIFVRTALYCNGVLKMNGHLIQEIDLKFLK